MSGVYCVACKNKYGTLDRYMFHRFPKDIERCKEWALLCHCPNLAYMGPGVCYRTYRLCSAHFHPTQYMGKRLINNSKPSIFSWSNSSKIDTKTNLACEPKEIESFSSQIKESTNVMNNPKRFKKSEESNKHSSFITETNTFYDNQLLLLKQFFIKTEMENITNTDIKMENSIHLIDHNYHHVPPVTDTINIYDKNRINGHLLEHNYFSQVSDTNTYCVKKRNNQHLLEHNYFLPVHNFKIKKEILHSDDTSEEDKFDGKTYEVPVTYSILPGVRLNSQVYMDNLHHRYYKHSSRNHVIYLVCENQKNKRKFCPVMASISIDMNNNRIKTTGQHNHLPRRVNISMVNLRRAIGLQATRSESLSIPIKQLYNQEITTNPEGAKNYSLLQSQLCVRRMRRRRKVSLII